MVRVAADRIIDYLEIAPKKCYFSVFNTFSNHECMMVAMRNHKKIDTIVNLWNNRSNEFETIEEFRERIRLEQPDLFKH